MHRTYPSRGKVLFEVLCALGMSASLVGAWMQTHATALLGAAGVAAFYALVHLFDMRRPKTSETAREVEVAEPQRIDFEPEVSEIVVPMVLAEEQSVEESAVEEVEAVKEVEVRAGSGRRSGGARKGAGRRAKAPKTAKVVELTPVEAMEAAWPMAEEPEGQELAAEIDEEFVLPTDDEASHPHIAPLFEPEPFARMQRRAFGRRGRL